MKIILINNLYKPYARGGAEKIAENTAKFLLQRGYDVKIITTRPFFSSQPIYEKETNIYYLRSLYYNLGNIPFFFRIFWHLLDMIWPGDYFRIKKILKKEQPDLVITHNLKGLGFLAPRAIKSLGIKHIHTLHDVQLLHPSGLMMYGEEKKINNIFSKIYFTTNRLLFGSPSFVISPSAWLLGLHDERGFFKNSKKYVLPNPIDISVEGDAFRPSEYLEFLYVGQVEYHKGISFLVKVFNKLGDKRTRLTVVGDGPILDELKKAAGENIIFLGRKNRNEVAELMKKANCLIVPSLCYENSPTVIYEAFAAELPVIASRIGGIPELLSDKFLFEPGNEETLMEKIRYFMNNRQDFSEEVSKNLRKIEELKTEKYIEKIISLI